MSPMMYLTDLPAFLFLIDHLYEKKQSSLIIHISVHGLVTVNDLQ